MKMRTAGRLQRIGLAAIPFVLAFLACGGGHGLGRRTADPGDPGQRRQRLHGGGLPGRNPSDRDPRPYAETTPTWQRSRNGSRRISPGWRRRGSHPGHSPGARSPGSTRPEHRGMDPGGRKSAFRRSPPSRGDHGPKREKLPQQAARLPEENAGPAVVVAPPEPRLGGPAPRRTSPTDGVRQRYFFRRNRSVFTDATRSRNRIRRGGPSRAGSPPPRTDRLDDPPLAVAAEGVDEHPLGTLDVAV